MGVGDCRRSLPIWTVRLFQNVPKKLLTFSSGTKRSLGCSTHLFFVNKKIDVYAVICCNSHQASYFLNRACLTSFQHCSSVKSKIQLSVLFEARLAHPQTASRMILFCFTFATNFLVRTSFKRVKLINNLSVKNVWNISLQQIYHIFSYTGFCLRFWKTHVECCICSCRAI